MAATKEGIEKLRQSSLLKKFGTTNLMEILGPAGTIPPTQSLCQRLAEFGIDNSNSSKWIKKNLPEDLLAKLKPYQQAFAKKAREVSRQPSIDALKQQSLVDRFGTTDLMEILGPAGTIPPTQSISQRLQEFGISRANTCKWIKNYIPDDLLSELKPYQQALINETRRKTNRTLYGGDGPTSSAIIRAKVAATNTIRYGSACALSNSGVQAKRRATCDARYGGHPSSLPPSKILERLEIYDLEPLEPIVYNSDRHQEIRVRCKHCGTEFTTRWTHSNSRGFHGRGLIACPCQANKSQLELWLLNALLDLGYTVKPFRPDWMPGKAAGHNLEVDIYFPNAGVGIELNGYACHNADFGINAGEPKSIDFHAYKSDCCFRNGVKLYHYWYESFDTVDVFDALRFCLRALSGEVLTLDDHMQISRDICPDPSVYGLPYEDLGPQPFKVQLGKDLVTCYTSGLWQFYPKNEEIQNTSKGNE